jgi:hypothetical protein
LGIGVARFAFVCLCVFVALASGFILADAQTPSRQPVVTGEWMGKYICGQGITALRLSVAGKPDGTLSATFNFGPLPENPEVPEGAYAMEGAFDAATRRLKLHGVKWIQAPFGYVMVDLDGRMTADGTRIAGIVPEVPGCTEFAIERGPALIS